MYEAIVCRLTNVRPHPNADRLKIATAHGYQVVVGIDTPEDQLGVFFGPDGQLSEEMCKANDLIQYTDPETGERRGGYFGKNRRVRSQKLRGEKSDGFWTGIDSFSFCGKFTLNEGDRFTELNGIPICNKYYTPATLRAMKGGTKATRRSNICFPEHVETKQLKHYISQIPAESIIYITEKLHGTSGRFGYVIDEKSSKKTWRDKILRREPRTVSAYDHLLGTRRVVLGDHTHEGFYGNEEFRWNAVQPLIDNTHKGEVFYFELVGYTTTGQSIMSPQDTSNLKKDLKQYSNPMVYKYGQQEGTCELYVYRITRTNEDGDVVELSWPQVKARCNELGIKHVPEFFTGPWVYDGHTEWLQENIEALMEGPSILDSSHIREGVVIRVESPNGETDFYKSKSFTFGVLEGYLKDSESYVDMEETS